VDPLSADCIGVDWLDRTFRVGEEFAERGNTLTDFVGYISPRFGEDSETDSCCDLGPLDYDPHHLSEATVLTGVLQ
jgi:hypothetical protein